MVGMEAGEMRKSASSVTGGVKTVTPLSDSARAKLTRRGSSSNAQRMHAMQQHDAGRMFDIAPASTGARRVCSSSPAKQNGFSVDDRGGRNCELAVVLRV